MPMSLQVARAFLQRCNLWRKECCGLRKKTVEKGPDAADYGVARWRIFLLQLLGLRRGGGAGVRGGRGGHLRNHRRGCERVVENQGGGEAGGGPGEHELRIE